MMVKQKKKTGEGATRIVSMSDDAVEKTMIDEGGEIVKRLHSNPDIVSEDFESEMLSRAWSLRYIWQNDVLIFRVAFYSRSIRTQLLASSNCAIGIFGPVFLNCKKGIFHGEPNCP